MATFKDNAGRDWLVSITTLQLKRVREATQFELAKLLDQKMRRLEEISSDPELLARVLFVLVRDQAAGKQVTEEQFFEGIAGDVLEGAFDAFITAYADFCPSHRRRLLLTMVTKQKEYTAAKATAAQEAIDKLDEAAIDNAIANSSATASPASSESIPPG